MKRAIAFGLCFFLSALLLFYIKKASEPREPLFSLKPTPAHEKGGGILESRIKMMADLPSIAIKNQQDRDQLVQAKLDNFVKKTAHITKESVAKEREMISRGLETAYRQLTQRPLVKRVMDSDGEAWEKLQFSDGFVRYIPLAREQTQ